MCQVEKIVSKQHDVPMSIARALGIILMVIGHVYAKDSVGVHFIYMFHMGLFFVLSGFFFKNITSVPMLRHFVWRKIRGLYFPYIGYSIVFLFLHGTLTYINGGVKYTASDYANKLVRILLTFSGQEAILVGFWFLKALFTASILYAILSLLLNKLRCQSLAPLVIIAIMVACMVMCNGTHRNLTIFGMLYGCVFFYIGIMIKQKSNIKYWQTFSTLILIVLVLLVSRIYKEIANTEFLSVDTMTILPFALTTTLGSLMVIGISHIINNKAHKLVITLLDYIGCHTMIILALHYPFFIVYERICQKLGASYLAPNIVKLLIGVFVPLLLLIIWQEARKRLYLSRQFKRNK